MSDFESAGVKAAFTCAVLGIVFVLSVVIARLVDMCYDRRTLADDASDISENTRQIIRARLSVIQFRKKEIKQARAGHRQSALDIVRKWINVVKERRKTRKDILKSSRPLEQNKDDVSKVHGMENGDINENKTISTPRFPVFLGAKVASLSNMPARDHPRPKPKLDSPIPVLPVQKGRPISARTHIMPNVIVTTAMINRPPPLILKTKRKSVHFDETKLPGTSTNTNNNNYDDDTEEIIPNSTGNDT